MPNIPTGGLSIFINIAILLIGFMVKSLKKFGFSLPLMTSVYRLIVDVRFDNILRKSLGYVVVAALFVLMSTVTSVSIYSRMTNESNIDYLKEGVERVIIIYKNKSVPEPTENKVLESKSKIDQNSLAFNN